MGDAATSRVVRRRAGAPLRGRRLPPHRHRRSGGAGPARAQPEQPLPQLHVPLATTGQPAPRRRVSGAAHAADGAQRPPAPRRRVHHPGDRLLRRVARRARRGQLCLHALGEGAQAQLAGIRMHRTYTARPRTHPARTPHTYRTHRTHTARTLLAHCTRLPSSTGSRCAWAAGCSAITSGAPTTPTPASTYHGRWSYDRTPRRRTTHHATYYECLTTWYLLLTRYISPSIKARCDVWSPAWRQAMLGAAASASATTARGGTASGGLSPEPDLVLIDHDVPPEVEARMYSSSSIYQIPNTEHMAYRLVQSPVCIYVCDADQRRSPVWLPIGFRP